MMKDYYNLLNAHPIKFAEQALYFKTIKYIRFNDDIPYINYKGRFNEGTDEEVIYPITILIYEISKMSEIYSGDVESIINLVTSNKNRALTEIDFDFPTYGISSPWRSGLAQGLFLSYLIRVKVYKNTTEYDDLIDKVYSKLILEREHGGFLENNQLWLEEYPMMPQGSFVLNGHLIALVSILEYYHLTKSGKVKVFLSKCLLDIESNVEKYNFFGWSKYCMYKNNVANLSYHTLHIDLFQYFLVNQSIQVLPKVRALNVQWRKNHDLYVNSVFYKGYINGVRILLGLRNRMFRK